MFNLNLEISQDNAEASYVHTATDKDVFKL